jgi:histidyl-tRNA synthetase
VERESSWAKTPAPSPTPPIACGGGFTAEGYDEIILPSLWEQRTFNEKAAGSPVLSQMWAFQDKGGRDVCLIPEATGIIQELYRQQWERTLPKPIRLFYIARCYRYERPQAGRYREFTQVGVEILGTDTSKDEAVAVLRKCLDEFGLNYKFVPAVKRGLTYYVEDGFEVECEQIGAQKQVAGGGRYPEGIGWAIGLDRLLLALNPRADAGTT